MGMRLTSGVLERTRASWTDILICLCAALEPVSARGLVKSDGENIKRPRMSSESRMRASMTAWREVWLVRGVEKAKDLGAGGGA